ncbi:MAG TPA: EDD domain protein [Coriobacteriia bacterium]|nr:EDD domain protein [Coriobacteriia bacterium]
MTFIPIVADSCCDMTDELKERLGVVTVPFGMDLGDTQYKDDAALNLPKFKEAMAKWHGRIGSAAPSPHSFYEAFKKTGAAFCLTISGKLSATNENAHLAAELLEADRESAGKATPPSSSDADCGKRIHIVDSLSASAGETLVAIKLRQLIDARFSELVILQRIEQFIHGMKTYFVLENIDNLLKNGRLNRVAGTLTSLLHIKPLLGSDGQGQIKLFGQTRSRKQTINKLVNTIAHSGRATTGEHLVISHCDNPSLAEELAERIRGLYDFAEIVIVPTGGLSSVYADQEGVVIAY